jgi:hypothetical protein
MGYIVITTMFRIAGGLLIYAALFLYESDEGEVQNRLEIWLVAVRRRREASLSHVVVILTAVASLSGQIFDRLFGKKLFSLRSFGASMCYSIASIVLFRDAMGVPFIDGLAYWVPLTLAWIVLFSQLATFPDEQSTKRVWRLWFIFICIFIVGIVFLGEGYELSGWGDVNNIGSPLPSWMAIAESVSSPLLVLGGSFVCDIFFIVFTRWLLERIALTTQVDRALALILLNFAVCAVLVGPGFIDTDPITTQPRFWAETQVKLLGQFNFLDSLVCALFAMILLGVLLHRLVWPFIERPLYSLHRFGVIKNKKLLCAVGTLLLIGPAKGIPIAKWLWGIATKEAAG